MAYDGAKLAKAQGDLNARPIKGGHHPAATTPPLSGNATGTTTTGTTKTCSSQVHVWSMPMQINLAPRSHSRTSPFTKQAIPQDGHLAPRHRDGSKAPSTMTVTSQGKGSQSRYLITTSPLELTLMASMAMPTTPSMRSSTSTTAGARWPGCPGPTAPPTTA